MRLLCLTGGILMLASSCAAPARAASGGPEDLPPEFTLVLREYERAWTAHDADALAALFTHDGWVLSSGRPPVQGREAIRSHYQGAGGPLFLRALAWERRADLGVLIGAFAVRADADPAGKFTLTLKRAEDGRWRILSDMDNGNSRP